MKQDKQRVKCQAKSTGFTLEDSIILDVDYAPRFLNDESKLNKFEYGSKASFDCETFEKPTRNPVKWFFKAQGSTKSELIGGKNEGTLVMTELLEKDIGEYKCVVGNAIGEVRRKFSVDLTPKSKFKIFLTIIKNFNKSTTFSLFSNSKDYDR